MSKKINYFVFILVLSLGSVASANPENAPDLPLTHCYHWLKEGYQKILTHKYKHAADNGGELTFYNSGGIAGNGLYCAKTLAASASYGDRVVKIEFVDDVVFYDQMKRQKICGTNGRFYATQAECDSKSEDVILFDSAQDWYVIKNQSAVRNWTANSPVLQSELTQAQKDFPGHAPFFQAALRGMQPEAQQEYLNTKSRLSIEDYLKNPESLKRVSALTALTIVSKLESEKLTSDLKRALFESAASRALFDRNIQFAAIEPHLKQHSEFEDLFRKELENLDDKKIDSYNLELVITSLEKLQMKISPAIEKQMAQAAALKAQKDLEASIIRAGGGRFFTVMEGHWLSKPCESYVSPGAVVKSLGGSSTNSDQKQIMQVVVVSNSVTDPKRDAAPGCQGSAFVNSLKGK